jgi:hypothetical protein
MLSHRIRGAAVIAATVSACVLPAVSQADAVKGSGGAKGCPVYHVDTGQSEIKPDGTVTIAASGSIIKCVNGDWVVQPGRVLTGNPVTITSPAIAPPVPG